MEPTNNILKVIQARAVLRQLLPMKPADENGEGDICHHALEGFLFGSVNCPMEYEPEDWGIILDEYFPETVSALPVLREKILILYDFILDNVFDEQLDKIHTLTFAEESRNGDPYLDPYISWRRGFNLSQAVSLEILRGSDLKPKPKKKIRGLLEEHHAACNRFFDVLDLHLERDKLDAEALASLQPFEELYKLPPRDIFETLMGFCSVHADQTAEKMEEYL